jgi:hypothetical protein
LKEFAYLMVVYVVFAHISWAASGSLFFTEPPSPSYYKGPPGHGKLKICKMPDFLNVDYSVSFDIPEGTRFADQGPNEGYIPGLPQFWLLTVATKESAVLKPTQQCIVVKAEVVPSTPPPAYPELRPVLRFSKSDGRYFEITATDDPDAPLPNLFPWNGDLPPLEASAASDFQ